MARSRIYQRFPVPLTLSSQENRSQQVSRERLVNMYAQKTGNTKAPYVLHSWPVMVGLERYDRDTGPASEPLTSNLGNIKSALVITEDSETLVSFLEPEAVIVFSDEGKWELDRFTPGGHFTLTIDSGNVLNSLPINADNLDIIQAPSSAPFVEFFATTGGAPWVTSNNVIGGLPTDVNPTLAISLNSRAIVNSTKDGERNKFYVSDVAISTSSPIYNFDPTANSATIESNEGPIVAIETFGQIVYFFSRNFIEPWQPIDTGNPPLARISQAIIQGVGAISSFSVVKTSQGIYFLSNQFKLLRLRGFGYEEVSTPPICDQIRVLDAKNCVAHRLDISGNTFVILEFPTDNRFLAYSEEAGTWAELKDSYDTGYNASGFVNAFGMMLLTRSDNGRVYELSLDSLAQSSDIQDGRTFQEVILPPISGELIGKPRQSIKMRRMVFGIQAGVAENNNDELVSNPMVSIDASTDGKTWGKQTWIPLGRQGEFDTKIKWDNKQTFKDLHVRLRFHGIAKVTIYSAAIDAREGGR